jgi:hypothetical protein
MTFRALLPSTLVFALLVGCTSAPQIVKQSDNTYSMTRTDRGGSFDDVGATKTSMMREANDFAAKQGKVASTVSMKDTPAAVQGFTVIDYQFKLVDKDALPQTAVLSARSDVVQASAPKASSVTNPASPLTRTQGPHSIDIYGELIKLDDLRKRGILTDEEFAREKKKVLDSN